eukprot:Tamp_10059.p1 GENE.Tamp_10059~~Tamp_10059.p1  ORF type:complete len:591 (-),score=104.47 Tamp_10059:262-2034(-)
MSGSRRGGRLPPDDEDIEGGAAMRSDKGRRARRQQPYSRRELVVLGLIAVVVIALLREWAGGGSGVATAPQASGPRGRDNAACPSACDNGKRIDNSVCPHLSGDAVEAILQSIDGNSVVWEWGEGSSAVYFAQCALEWNVVISDRQHCSDIKALASPNVKVHCVDSEHGYEGSIRQMQAARVDVLIADGARKPECLNAAVRHLKPSAKVFVPKWEAALRGHILVKQFYELADVVGADRLALLHLRGAGHSAGGAAGVSGAAGAAVVVAPRGAAVERVGRVAGHGDQVDGTQIGKTGDKLTQYVSGAWNENVHGDKKVQRGGGGDGSGKQTAEMLAWQENKQVLSWKENVRHNVLTDPVPDKWGPKEAYPCPASCPHSGLPMVNVACPMMWPREAKLLLSVLKPESVVLEWGSGTSSLYYSQCVTNWTSIEHHVPWCHEMQTLAPPNLRVKCVPIEKEYEVSFGSPGTWDGSKKEFKTYVEAAKEAARMPNGVDIVIIDGRARGDCSIEVLPYLRADSLVFIHDWIKGRMGGTEQYDKSLEFYDIVDVVHIKPPTQWRSPSGLVMLKPKPEALEKAKKALELANARLSTSS